MKRRRIFPVIILALSIAGCAAAPTTLAPSNQDTGASSKSELSYPRASASPNYDAGFAYPSSEPSAPYPEPTAAASSAPGVTTGSGDASRAILPPVAPPDLETANQFKDYGINTFVKASEDKFSTFAIDVDTASYTWMRKSLENNIMPSADSVRVEEYINYFDYNYPLPQERKFSINTDLVSDISSNNKFLRVGIKGKEINAENRKNAVLTFVIDISGSMNRENRLGLVKQSLELLLNELKPGDQVGIVTYGSEASVLMEHKGITNKQEIMNAIESISSQGATNAEAGLLLAYQQAEKNFKAGAINRVILCSDGVANVGDTGPDTILKKIKQQSESGITLSTIGFGMGNYNDVMMEQLANDGDGNYSYVDNIKEAERIFVQNLTGTLQVIAKDAKIQIEFDPQIVDEYRLIGYENRDVSDDDFRDDTVDGGEIGAGHSVTAIYELKLKDSAASANLATINLRYKDVDQSDTVLEINKNVSLESLQAYDSSSASYKLAKLVSDYAEILRTKNNPEINSQLSNLLERAKMINNSLDDPDKVSELISLIQKAVQLSSSSQQ